MSIGATIEVAAGIALLIGAIWLYRRPVTDGAEGAERHYGNQGAVIVLVIAAILLIHGLGGLEYHPSQSELDAGQ